SRSCSRRGNRCRRARARPAGEGWLRRRGSGSGNAASLLLALHVDAAFAEHVAHFARAAVERLAGPEADARAALADRNGDAAVVAAVGADARRFGGGLEQRIAVYPYRR